MPWKVWANDDELAFEFIEGKKHVVVSFETDGQRFAYAIRRGDKFNPGAHGTDDPIAIADEINEAIAD